MVAWTLSTWTDAAQLASAVSPRNISEEARGVPPPVWFAQLNATGKSTEATMFLAHAMPRYECVVWALRSLLELEAADRGDPAIIAALRWADNPSDTLRRATFAITENIDDEAPAAMLCQAIFLSGGSISEEDLPPVQPKPDTCAKLAAAAVLAAAFAQDDPTQALARSHSLGEAILSGA